MITEFPKQVQEVVELIHRSDYLALGRHPLSDLRIVHVKFETGMIPSEWKEGQMLTEVIRETTEKLKPEGDEDLEQTGWRCYHFLKEYAKPYGRSWNYIADSMSVGKTLFFNIKRQAIESLANVLWDEEQKTRLKHKPKTNLGPDRDIEFVPRVDAKGNDYVERIIDLLLRPKIGVVAIEGAGGVGKTTVARELAFRCVERALFKAVIWTTAKLAELTPRALVLMKGSVTSLDDILFTIADTLGSRRIMTLGNPAERHNEVNKLLGEKPYLVILDNLESLNKETLNEISDFLLNMPAPSKALLTSREQMQGGGEYVVTLYGMNPDEATIFIRKECERRDLKGITDTAMQEIYEICEGVPAAMQFLLALIKFYGYRVPDAIRSPQARELLLPFLFEESYNQLSSDERHILHVMPIFLAPSPRDVISAACQIEGAHFDAAMGRLYYFSLVRKEEERYSIWELARPFIENLITDKSIQNTAYLNLAEYFASFEPMDLQERMTFFKSRKENIDTTMKWCYNYQKWQLVLKLAESFSICYGLLGRWQTRYEWGKMAMLASQELRDSHRHTWHWVYDVGYVHLLRGGDEVEIAKQIFQEAVRIGEQKEYQDVATLAMRNLGYIACEEGRFEEALVLLEKSLELSKEVNSPLLVAMVQKVLARSMHKMGRLTEARQLLENVLTTVRDEGDDYEEVVKVASDLGLVMYKLRELDEAENLLRMAAEGAESRSLDRAIAYNMNRRAEVEEIKGNKDKARILAEKAYNIYNDLGAGYWTREPKELLDRVISNED